jgi:hypothetical protein
MYAVTAGAAVDGERACELVESGREFAVTPVIE